jgi:hypothetical protein
VLQAARYLVAVGLGEAFFVFTDAVNQGIGN